MKNFCEDLKKHVKRIVNYEKKEIIPLTKKEQKMNDKAKTCHICKERFSTDVNYEQYLKVRDHYHYTGKHRGAAHTICNLRYKTPKEIPLMFHNGSTYDYHLIIKELAKEFEGQIEFVCSYHVTYAFQSESTLYSCLNVKELLARNRREI